MSKSDTNEWLKEVVELSMLYDFYGELLSEGSKRAFEGYVLEDMTLAELSDETGVSRQGIYDTVKRSVKKLRAYEEKLRLVAKFKDMKSEVDRIRELAARIKEGEVSEADRIIEIAEKMLDDV